MPLSFRPRSRSNASSTTPVLDPQLDPASLVANSSSSNEVNANYEGAPLSATSSYSSFSELESAALTANGAPPSTRKRDGTLSRSNSVSLKLKGLFHKSPQNSALHLPLGKQVQQLQLLQVASPDRVPSPKIELDRHDAALSRTASATSVNTRRDAAQPMSGTPSPLLKASASEPDVQTKPELKKSLSNSDINGAMLKLKLQMPPVIENDLDEVLEAADESSEEGERKPVPNQVLNQVASQVPAPIRGRIPRVKSPASSESSVSSRSRSQSRLRESLVADSSYSKEFLDKLKTVKHHKVGKLIVFDDGTRPHLHDYGRLKKDPVQTSPSGILSSLLGVKKREDNQLDHLHDMKLEGSFSLLPDTYSEELILFKLKPENFRYDFEEYLYGEGFVSGQESDYETDSDYDSDEDIDPIIGDAQLDIINKLVEKIEHIDKYKEKLVSMKKLRLVEKYGRIQGVVGKGSYGVVKLAVKQLPDKSQRIFAIKELKRKPNENIHHFSNRLTSEFMISSSLTHQSIINTYDLMVDFATHTYLQVMDYVPCGDLFSLVQASNGEGLHPLELDCFFKQILNAVSYLHSVGISHNDLKIENLLLTLTGQLKIIDFGTSTPVKCAWENTCSRLSGPQGSEPYCGPEMFSQKDYDPRLLDIWSLGVIYLVMINGGYVWKLANAKSDSAYHYYLESRPGVDNAKGSFDIIEGMTGKNKNSKKKVLYAMLDPDPSTRLKLREIWKSRWVKHIEVCDAGKGLEPVIY